MCKQNCKQAATRTSSNSIYVCVEHIKQPWKQSAWPPVVLHKKYNPVREMQLLYIQNCASIIFYWMQMFNGSITDAIQNIPAELREIINVQRISYLED